jgi:hypothetical protein
VKALELRVNERDTALIVDRCMSPASCVMGDVKHGHQMTAEERLVTYTNHAAKVGRLLGIKLAQRRGAKR